MMKPFDLIARFFKKAGDIPSPDGIAQGPAIATTAVSFLKLVVTLNVLTLTSSQRQAMAGKGDPGQRRRSEAFQAFLARRPDFVQRTQIDPGVYQIVIDKDESYDILLGTLTLCAQCIADGQLQIAVWLSDKIGGVLGYTAKIFAPGAAAELLPERVNFTAVRVGQGEQQVKVVAHQDRVERKLEVRQQGLAATQHDKTHLGKVDKLADDAAAGGGPLGPAQALPKPPKAARSPKAKEPRAAKTTKRTVH